MELQVAKRDVVGGVCAAGHALDRQLVHGVLEPDAGHAQRVLDVAPRHMDEHALALPLLLGRAVEHAR